MLIVLTGGIGCGKTYVAKIFEQLNIPVIYSDQIAKELIINNIVIKQQIQKYFNIFDLNQNLTKNLKKIKIQIFKNKKKRLFLEKLIHKKTLENIKLKIKILNNNQNICIVEIPMLHNLNNILKILKAEKIIFMECERNIQLSRVMHRDKLSKSQVMLIIRSQLYSQNAINKIYKSADYVLSADELKQLHMQVITICCLLKNILQNTNNYLSDIN